MALEGLQFLEGFGGDIRQFLPRAQRMILELLVDIRNGELEGESLAKQASTGDLSDCFKIYFDDDPDFSELSEMRYRLVYRKLEDGTVEGVVIEGVAVGRRHNKDAYLRALENLGRAQ